MMTDSWANDDGVAINPQRYDIRVLDGLRESTRIALRRQGIHGVHQLAALSVEELQQFNGIGKVTAPAIKAHAQAWMEQRAVWYNPLRATCASESRRKFSLSGRAT
jgi:predicted RecB family nuclease